MDFVSSRSPNQKVTFKEAVSNGIAPDGGLYIPTRIPVLDKRVFSPEIPFQERSFLVLQAWLGTCFSNQELAEIVHEALTFPVPIVPHPGGFGSDIHMLELFHGPTLSFKDVGARCLAAFLKRIPEGPGQTIFVATSGDTGSAVADAFSQSGAFQVALLFPEHGVSKLQKLQLTLERPGVRAFAIDGTFDDCQRLVKTAFADFDNAHLRPGSANSINIGRLLPQMLYYIHAAAIVNQPFEVAVPSGNLGNITSAWFAQQSGAPIKRLIAAHNANHPFTTFVETGNYLPGATVPTLSNAMDVGAPSNFERLRSLLSDQAFKSTFRSGFCTDAETLAAMATSFQNGYIADPHTSVGLHVSHGLRNPSLPLLVAATAHPAKFPDAFVEAKLPVPEHPELAKLAHEKHQVIRCSPEYNTFKSTVHEAFRVR